MATSAQTTGPEPPRWLIELMKFVLRTPLHGIFSKSIMVLVFQGRKSGKIYSTPVSYLREGDVVTAFTDSPWQRNLRGGAPVTLYLKGKAVEGFAEIIDNREAVTDGLTRFLDKVHRDAKFYDVQYDNAGQPIREQVERASHQHVMIKIQLSPSLPTHT